MDESEYPSGSGLPAQVASNCHGHEDMLSKCRDDEMFHYFDDYGHFDDEGEEWNYHYYHSWYGTRHPRRGSGDYMYEKDQDEADKDLYDWANEEFGDTIYDNGLDYKEVAVKCREYCCSQPWK